jgi:hypothetical protein
MAKVRDMLLNKKIANLFCQLIVFEIIGVLLIMFGCLFPEQSCKPLEYAFGISPSHFIVYSVFALPWMLLLIFISHPIGWIVVAILPFYITYFQIRSPAFDNDTLFGVMAIGYVVSWVALFVSIILWKRKRLRSLKEGDVHNNIKIS